MLSVPTPLIPCLVVTCAWRWLFSVEATKHLYDVWAQWPLNYFIQGWNSSYQPTQMLRMDCFMWYYFHQSHIWCSPLIFLINYPKGSRISIDGPTYRLSESNTTLMGKLVWVSRLSRCPVSWCVISRTDGATTALSQDLVSKNRTAAHSWINLSSPKPSNCCATGQALRGSCMVWGIAE